MSRRFQSFDFFFQAEDGIRDRDVTGVQTCALPICRRAFKMRVGGQAGQRRMEDSTAGVLFPETWYMLTTMAGRSRPVAMEARFRRSLSSFVQKMAATPGIRELLRHAFEVVRGVVPVDAMFIAALTGERRYLKMLETDLD